MKKEKLQLYFIKDGHGNEFITGESEYLYHECMMDVAKTGKCELYEIKFIKRKERKPKEVHKLVKIYDVNDLNEYIRKGLEDGTIRRKRID